MKQIFDKNFIWKNPQHVIEALSSHVEDYNAKMLNKRFDFITKKLSRLPDRLNVIEILYKTVYDSILLMNLN
jgi:hypothetical protein